MQQLVFQMWGAKEFKTIQDLKGKSVAASTPRAALDTATREALKRNGLAPDKDVQILYVQTVPAILSSIHRRQDRRRHTLGAEYSQGKRSGFESVGRYRQAQYSGASGCLRHNGEVSQKQSQYRICVS